MLPAMSMEVGNANGGQHVINVAGEARPQRNDIGRQQNIIDLPRRALGLLQRRPTITDGEPKVEILQWTSPIIFAIFTIAVAKDNPSLSKHLLRVVVVLISMIFVCLLFRVVFQRKVSPESLNVAANLALIFNVIAFFLMMGVCFAQI